MVFISFLIMRSAQFRATREKRRKLCLLRNFMSRTFKGETEDLSLRHEARHEIHVPRSAYERTVEMNGIAAGKTNSEN